ncbi:hypothetical protein [Occultella gossypii]|uniref:Uncharacterized protein n=1 Tax=Occultella gossypii TaxID=2800820 RepID=A0ABS7SCG3_9MICO|nr:hypothetical protein [Occultella gossypii]MBZ2197578.1 hypothetical protein [Occultella gossypii]
MSSSRQRGRSAGLGRIPSVVWLAVALVSVVAMMASIGESSAPLLSTPAIFAATFLVAAFGYARSTAKRAPREAAADDARDSPGEDTGTVHPGPPESTGAESTGERSGRDTSPDPSR